ncbi:hypothetical protein GA0061098_105315 [Bradyrhizobium shewense]|uniref:Uncharacterized protein n=1 Tax=Bradyrhizobium shewense TaxID=1761772 RepID=A0A1C3XU50_9BRAD|nr:hypothetical protein [Bradyrhizobium shewense]SCB55772.1 hypothetical protein GA0061098_105315 [Bradyrhizobium shewense]
MAELRLDPATLIRLIGRYQELRNRGGMGSMLYRVTPGQRIDALQIYATVCAAGAVPDGDQREFWLSHLRPVLAETREAAELLKEAFADIGKPETPPLTQRIVGTSVATVTKLRRWPSVTTLAAVGAALLVGAVILWLSLTAQSPQRQVASVDTTDWSVPAGNGAQSALPDAGLKPRYERFLKLTLVAAARYGNEITPYVLAAALCGAAPELGPPSYVLAEMMRVYPIDPANSIPHSAFGAMALRHYAAVAAAQSAGASLAAFDDFIMDDGQISPDPAIDPAAWLRNFQTATNPLPPATLARETWPSWLRYLPLLVLLPGSVFAFWGKSNKRREAAAEALRRTRVAHATFRRAEAGAWGTSRILQSFAALPPLPSASQTARRLMRLREPMPGSRLDLPRSVRASVASAGDVVTVKRDGSRAVDIVVLVHRGHRHDHERARVLRLLDALSRGGVSLTAYDYAPDPRTLTATSRADALNPRGRLRTLDLRGLRELHGDSLLVIVSDGDELIDPFSQQPHSFLATELASWRRRMLLTPVPRGEWGEREFRLAAALDAPIGRATMAGLGDLALGLAPDEVQSGPRRALDQAMRRAGLLDRIATWSLLAGTLLAPEETVPRPPSIERLGLSLLQDLAPPDPEQKALIEDLETWLGHGFFWLAACGVYPKLRVDLTLWLGARLHRYGHPANPVIFSEELFARLCLLPWLRVCHMPDWLRTAMFNALSDREKQMLRDVVDELAAGKAGESGEARLGLQVWQADWRGQPLAPDNVMIAFKSDAAPSDRLRQDEAAAASDARRTWLMRGLGRLALIAAWAGVAVWLMPAFGAAPLPDGAWWPVLGFGAATLAWFGTAFVVERVRLWRRKHAEAAADAAPRGSAAPAFK